MDKTQLAQKWYRDKLTKDEKEKKLNNKKHEKQK